MVSVRCRGAWVCVVVAPSRWDVDAAVSVVRAVRCGGVVPSVARCAFGGVVVGALLLLLRGVFLGGVRAASGHTAWQLCACAGPGAGAPACAVPTADAETAPWHSAACCDDVFTSASCTHTHCSTHAGAWRIVADGRARAHTGAENEIGDAGARDLAEALKVNTAVTSIELASKSLRRGVAARARADTCAAAPSHR